MAHMSAPPAEPLPLYFPDLASSFTPQWTLDKLRILATFCRAKCSGRRGLLCFAVLRRGGRTQALLRESKQKKGEEKNTFDWLGHFLLV